ncbi:MAG TPA: S8 family serine peptidase, partial [Pseudolabrys sp.]|nr:S8 family serine peptidase [Pseudolabrys sp.]
MIDGISPQAMAQIEALIREKDARRGVELRMDSQLIYELKMRRGQAVAEGIQRVETDIEYDNQGKVELDLKAVVSDTLLAQLRGSGALVVNSVPSGKHVRILVNIDQIESIAALPGVEFIQPKQEAMTAGIERPQRVGETPRYQRSGGEGAVVDDVGHDASKRMTYPGFDARAARVQNYISAALNGAQPNVQGSFSTFTGVGSRSSEGDITHRANTARGTFHVDGTGIKIGVLSDGVTALATSQALGDLGPVTVLPGQAGSGNEGTAMLEIIHDLAPGAQLFFATAFGGITSFAQNIRDLRTAGCDIIVDDVFYFVETPFQDGQAPGIVSNTNGGVVIQAVNDVTAAGALYFSSAGNSGNLTDGTAGVWEGDFADGGATGPPIPAGSAGNVHNFGGQNFNTLTLANAGAPINLYWSDPLGGSSNDYDLFRLNAAGTAIASSSTNIQNGTQDPIEQISQNTANPRVVIVKKTGAANRFLHLNANRGRFSISTSGQTHGHSHAANAFSCAATPAVGPFPNPHSGANVSETFTSDGPRRIFYQADGTPFTPMDLSSTGGILRQKPDITAADGVMVTGVGGFPSPFFGTSASAPHAAAIAGLLKSANPAFTPAQIRTALTSSAIDIEAPGVDRDTGAGIITAFGAMQALGVPGTAFLEFVSITANEDPGDGNGQLDAGEGANLSIQLKNSGV